MYSTDILRKSYLYLIKKGLRLQILKIENGQSQNGDSDIAHYFSSIIHLKYIYMPFFINYSITLMQRYLKKISLKYCLQYFLWFCVWLLNFETVVNKMSFSQLIELKFYSTEFWSTHHKFIIDPRFYVSFKLKDNIFQ